jgi:serine/threonine-protein kinase
LNAASPLLPALAERQIGPGHVLGRYELLMPIAAGGMAMVWAARLKGTRGFQKIFAVKTMLPNLVEDDQFEQMFLDEASLASKIRHPNAVEIIDLGEQNGVLFLAMEWIDGVPLHHVMKVAKRQGGVPATVAVRIVMQACAGLHAAHELTDGKGRTLGLVHRDISPQNILVTFDGVAKVVDFGVAKATALGGGTTRAGQVKGKIGYMAPEQGRGEAIDRRADVFAMGIVLYALTTGQHPFRREADAATLFAITSAEPVVSPRKLVPSYPATLERVVLKALEKDREKRFASARELFHELDKALPLHTRGSDEEVGAFITGLFAEQRRQSQAALADALERAEANQLAELKSNPYQEITGNGRSGVNAVSNVGVTARIEPPVSPPLAPANDSQVEPFTPPATRSPRQLLLGASIGLALAASLALIGYGEPTQPVATLKPALSRLTSLPSEAAPSASAASSRGTGAGEGKLPRATATSIAPTSSAPPPNLKQRPLTPAGARTPVTKKPWKQDPGF